MPGSTVLKLIWLTHRNVLSVTPKSTAFIECTQFVTGVLSRDCRGALIAFSTKADEGPWHLGIIQSLVYTNKATSNIDGMLSVYRWNGPTHQLENGMCVLEFCRVTHTEFTRHFCLEKVSFAGGDNLHLCFLNQVCGINLDRNSCN